MSTTATLADGLLDDAAMFPPGNASAETAIRQHVGHRSAWYARLVGPLLVHAQRWEEFTTAHAALGSPELDLVVIGSAERPRSVPPTVSIVGVEVVASDADPADLAEAPGGLALEIPALGRLDEVADTVATLRARGVAAILKYRTGGADPAAFPPASEVAAVIGCAVRRGLPIKFTAGLHHAVRHQDPATGFEHHGFLNLLWAVRARQVGLPPARCAQIVDERDAETVVAAIRSWRIDDVSAARGTFTSFGCCGVTDPVHDLVRLGLIEEET